MKLTDIIAKKAIVHSIRAKDKRGVVAELAAAMKKAYPDEKLTPQELVDAIMAREELGSTGLHGGVAIPHAHLKQMKDVRGAFGRCAHPVDFRAVDGGPTHLVFLIVAPPSRNEAYLQALHKISAAIKGSHFCKFLRAAKTSKEIEDVLKESEETAKV